MLLSLLAACCLYKASFLGVPYCVVSPRPHLAEYCGTAAAAAAVAAAVGPATCCLLLLLAAADECRIAGLLGDQSAAAVATVVAIVA